MALSPEQVTEVQREVDAFIARRYERSGRHSTFNLSARLSGAELVLASHHKAFDSERIIESRIARAKWIKSRRVWRLYWQRQNMKWHLYEMGTHPKSIRRVLDEIDKDPHGCFFG